MSESAWLGRMQIYPWLAQKSAKGKYTLAELYAPWEKMMTGCGFSSRGMQMVIASVLFRCVSRSSAQAIVSTGRVVWAGPVAASSSTTTEKMHIDDLMGHLGGE